MTDNTVGLCLKCRWSRVAVSDRGSEFRLCRKSAEDPRFPKYPRLPVLRCAGFDELRGPEPPAEASLR